MRLRVLRSVSINNHSIVPVDPLPRRVRFPQDALIRQLCSGEINRRVVRRSICVCSIALPFAQAAVTGLPVGSVLLNL
jgi:hypothetical protein